MVELNNEAETISATQMTTEQQLNQQQPIQMQLQGETKVKVHDTESGGESDVTQEAVGNADDKI